MVFDSAKDEMISLEEFRRRTQSRCLATASRTLNGGERDHALNHGSFAPSSSTDTNMTDLEEGEIHMDARKRLAPEEVEISSKRARLTHHGALSSP